jgi:hypothetical protein
LFISYCISGSHVWSNCFLLSLVKNTLPLIYLSGDVCTAKETVVIYPRNALMLPFLDSNLMLVHNSLNHDLSVFRQSPMMLLIKFQCLSTANRIFCCWWSWAATYDE